MKQVLTICILLSLLFVFAPGYAQTDSLAAVKATADSIQLAKRKAAIDSAAVERYAQLKGTQSVLTNGEKPVVNDVEQMVRSNKSIIVFLSLLLLFGAITYLKVVYSKDFEELFQSFANRNLSQQIFRSQRGELSFSSTVLHLNFILAISFYVRFVMMHYFHVSSLERVSTIIFLCFLFTLFYVGKILVVKAIGIVFEMKDICDEYIFNFVLVCKITGLSLLPVIFIFYTAPEKYFDFIFVLTFFIFSVLVLFLLWRGLSTAYKLLYRSVYHFFIYVCVVEISMIFLLFKLLTKTIT